MKLFLFLLLCGGIHQYSASYLRKSELCRPWVCITEHLGLEKNDVNKDKLIDTFSYLLPSDTWQKDIPTIIDECHGEINSSLYTYIDTCPGQSMLRCIVNQLVDRCPEKYVQQEDACTPVSSLAGFKHMFSQSRYNHFDQNISYDRRPGWFLKNYFSKHCCNIPQLFNNTILEQCGFSTIMKYYESKPVTFGTLAPVIYPSNGLECCDLSGFLEPRDYNQCQFNLKWHGTDRFKLNDVKSGVETATPPSILMDSFDVQVVPLSCDVEECIFKSLQIVSHTGQVDLVAFSKLLDNYTRDYPEWISAKARVATTCLSKPITDYTADCEINKVLACTLDVLSENCPYNKNGTDSCRHKNAEENKLCQTSSSRHRPKRRRQLCDFPPLIKNVNHICGYNYYAVNKVSRPVRITQKLLKNTAAIKRFLHYKSTCLQTSESAKCVMSKMGILNKYGFIDYFKAKSKLNTFTSDDSEWSKLKNDYMNTFYQSNYYKQHCTSQKKLLNILDSMIMTCPLSKRNNSPQCQNLFNQASVQPRSTEVKQSPFTKVFFGRSRPNTYIIRIPFSRSYVPATWENSNLNVDPMLFKNYQTTTAKGQRTWETKRSANNSSSPLILLPVYMREPRKYELLP